MTVPTCELCAKPVGDQAFVCSKCVEVVERALGGVPAHAHELATTVTRTDRIQRSGGGRSVVEELHVGPICATYRRRHHCEHESCHAVRPLTTALLVTAAPFAVDAAATVDASTNALVNAARHIAETRGLELPGRTTHGPVCEVTWPPEQSSRHDSCATIRRGRELPVGQDVA